MFGVRAKALFVYLAVSFVLDGKGKTDSAKTNEFSCSFDDKEYKMERNTTIWSTSTPASLKIDPNLPFGEDEFETLYSKISSAFTKVMENHSLNNVDQFIRFIQAYKNQTGDKKSLEEFFNGYHVPFQPLEDPVSFLVEINKQLTNMYPRTKNLMYIVSAYVDPQSNFVNDVLNANMNDEKIFQFDKEKTASNELTKYRFQRHVAGVIKVKYGQVSYETEGIILLDPGYINGDVRVNPYSVVLMDNYNSFYERDAVYGVGSRVRDGRFYDERKKPKYEGYLRKKFALVTATPSKQNPRHEVLYLRYKPFCSFMDSTTKGNLLAPNYGIMSFRSDGSPKGYLTFNVPQNITEKKPFFRIGPFNETTEEYLGKEFTFDSIKPGNHNNINNYTAYMTLEKDYDLIGKLQTIQSEVFEHPDLVKEIYELTNKLLNQKIKKEDSWFRSIGFQGLCSTGV